MLKKATSILLVAILSLNTVPIAGAVELEASQQDSEEECVETVVENIDFTVNELETYSAMQMEEVGIQFDGDIYQELDQFEPIKEETVGQMTICYYDPENLEQFYIPNVEKIIEFSKADQDFLITYTTENQQFVMAYYHPDGSYGFAMNPDINTSDQVVEYSSQSEKVKVYQFSGSGFERL